MQIKVKALTFFIVLCLSLPAFTQVDSVSTFIQQHQSINKNGMLALGAWSIINGGYSLSQIDRSVTPTKLEYFHEMNVAWSGVNLILAGFFYTNNRRVVKDTSFTTAVKLNASTKKTFGSNVLLDGVYIGLGIGLNKLAQQTNGQRAAMQSGFGNAIAYQGAFLLVFDAIMYGMHHVHGKKLSNLAQHVSIYPNAIIWHI